MCGRFIEFLWQFDCIEFIEICSNNSTECDAGNLEFSGHNNLLIDEIACKFPNLEELNYFRADYFVDDNFLDDPLIGAEKSLHQWKQLNRDGFSDMGNRYRSKKFINCLIIYKL